MLTVVAAPHLTHILKSTQQNLDTVLWIRGIDAAHLSAWLHCLTTSSDLENDLTPPERKLLSELLDTPPLLQRVKASLS